MSESAAKEKKIGTRRPLIIAGVVIITLAIAASLAATGYVFAYQNRVVPGVTVNGLALGGLTKEEANAKLNAAITIYENNGLNFTDGKKIENIDATQIPDGNPDAAHQILTIDEDGGLASALAVGHAGGFFTRLAEMSNA